MHGLTRLASTTALVLAGSLAAQGRTWVVDAANGPGTSFTNIPPALQAAQDGDTILVRSGTYDGGTITRGIRMIADAGASVRVRVPSGLFAGPAIDVNGLQTGRTVVLEGLGPSMESAVFAGVFVRMRDCAGHVHCDNLDGSLIGSSGGQATGISIVDCAHVSVHDSSLRDGTPMSTVRSTVLVTDSMLTGQTGFSGLGGFSDSSPAINALQSRLTIARSRIAGGGGAFLGFAQPSEAISAIGGTLLITGGSEARVVAGTGFGLPSPTHAIAGSGATITVDPRVTLTGTGGASAIAAGHTSALQRVPALSATAGPPGGTLDLDLLASSGDLAEVYLSLPFGPVASPIPGTGEIWVDFRLLLILGRFAVPASEQVQLQLPIPTIPGLRGAVLTSQALTASAAAGFRFGTPVTFALN